MQHSGDDSRRPAPIPPDALTIAGGGGGPGAHRAAAVGQGTGCRRPGCQGSRRASQPCLCPRHDRSPSTLRRPSLLPRNARHPFRLQLRGSKVAEKVNDKFSATMTNVVRWRECRGAPANSDDEDAPAASKEIVSDTSIQVRRDQQRWMQRAS